MKYSMLKEKVVNLIASIFIALSFILVLQITVNAKIEKEDEIIAIIQQDNEDNPESTAYLVTDKYVSNVAPETSMETFRKNIEEGITIYENATKQKEVTDEIIKTGMVLEYNQNGRIFDISVLGDINGDGILNQIELTREIRDILETENWKIEKEIEKLAGDIERDKKIDEKDTEAIINYIVFGKLNIGEFEIVEKPEIEVTGENYEEDRYRGNVNVKITEKNEKTKTQKTVYKVIGSEEKEYKVIDAQEELKIETDGVFKVTAYTYGIEGNKSKGNSEIIIREAPTYTVKYLPGTHGKFKEQEISGLHKEDMTPEFKGDVLGNPGYKFAGWSEEISETVEGDKEYTAKWDTIEYKIEYVLNGGSLGEETNPERYTIETESFTLNNPSKVGYTFGGWTEVNGGEPKLVVTIEQGSIEDKTYIANWIPNPDTRYTVEIYEMNLNGEYIKINAEEKTGETDTEVSVNVISKEGFAYEENLSTPIGTISADGSTVLKVYYSRNKYKVTITGGNGIESVTGDREYYYGEEITIDAIVKPGYTWDKWTSDNENIPESTDKEYKIPMPIGDTTITPNTKLNKYEITYDLTGGNLVEGVENKTEYTVETETFTLNNPIRTGYIFTGWTGSNGESSETTVTIAKGSIGNKTYVANWIVNEYTLSINPNGGQWNGETTNSTITQNYGTTKIVPTPTRKGYTFTGWTLTGKGAITKTTPITTANQTYTYGAGDATLTANWTINKYTLSVVAENGGTVSGDSGEIEYETTVEVKATAKVGYKFIGWYEGETKVSDLANYTFNMPNKNRSLVAKFKTMPYTITYDLAGGSLETGKTNPVEYTVETDDITLNNPMKVGYTFIGWTGSNVETANTAVTIAKGSIGNKTYKANWVANTNTRYTVETYEMNLSGDYVKISKEEKSGETDKTVLIDVQAKEGFTYEEALSNVTGVILPNGDSVFKIYYSRNKYSLSVNHDNGISNVSNAGEYYYGANIVVDATVKSGYTWSKWTSSNASLIADSISKTYNVTIPAGNVTLTAKTTIITYTITYDLTGGALPYGETNPTEYTVETDNIILEAPRKTGYIFTGWTGSNGTIANKTVIIEKGSIGNKTYTANWKESTGTQYTEQLYQMDLNGDYVKVKDEITEGTTGAEVSMSTTAPEGFTYEESLSTPIGTIAADGSTVLKIYYSRNKYTLNVSNGTGIDSVTGAGSYYYGANIVVDATVKSGYTWAKWTSNSTKISESTDKEYTITIPAEDITLNAEATINTYTITYNLVEGMLETGKTNPVEYTVETDDIILNNPIKEGYTFTGWTGSNGETEQITVTIAQGSTGNKTYTANWSKNSYTLTIHHYLENADDNKYSKVGKTTDTIEYGALITLADYKITITDGTYYFGSLTCSDSETEENAITTTTMGTGAEIALYYSRNKYELTLEKNEYILNVNGTGTYKVGQQVNISATLKIADTGYTNTFVKWTENDEEKYPDQEKEFTMPARDVTLKAIGTTTINKYPVTYIDKTQVTDESGNIVDKVLGSETKDKDYGTTVRGNELGSDSLTGTYYTGYYYVEDTQKVVTTEGATVYRIFKLHPTMSISINNSEVNLFDDITTEFITTVTATPGDTFNYKWEYCEDTSAENATYEPIGKTGSSYSIATTQMTENGLGTSYLGGYYKCTVTNAEGKTADVTGTQTVLYTIKSETQMKNFAKRVNNQSITFKTLQNNGGEVSLINNVSINDPWETVGRNTTRTFKGTFNGNNKTVTFNNIKNLDSSRARSIWSG